MSIIATCGHKLKEWEELGIHVEYTDYQRDNSPCTVYATYCIDCALDWFNDCHNQEEIIYEIRKLLKEIE
jgi:hypothetical protein